MVREHGEVRERKKHRERIEERTIARARERRIGYVNSIELRLSACTNKCNCAIKTMTCEISKISSVLLRFHLQWLIFSWIFQHLSRRWSCMKLVTSRRVMLHISCDLKSLFHLIAACGYVDEQSDSAARRGKLKEKNTWNQLRVQPAYDQWIH